MCTYLLFVMCMYLVKQHTNRHTRQVIHNSRPIYIFKQIRHLWSLHKDLLRRHVCDLEVPNRRIQEYTRTQETFTHGSASITNSSSKARKSQSERRHQQSLKWLLFALADYHIADQKRYMRRHAYSLKPAWASIPRPFFEIRSKSALSSFLWKLAQKKNARSESTI